MTRGTPFVFLAIGRLHLNDALAGAIALDDQGVR